MREPICSVEGVAKSFKRRPVLRDVSLSLERGSIVGIVGENGCGKSTLLRILVGHLAADRGRVAIRAPLGYCPQQPTLFESLTVDENLACFAAAYGLTGATRARWQPIRDRLFDRLDFGRYRRTLVARLSGGTRQKLNLVLALLHAPELLVLDEPYSAFDWQTYLRFWDLAREMKAANKTILLVSHLVYDRSNIDRLLELSGGEIRC